MARGAHEFILQYRYRRMFGLSWKDFVNEPSSIYLVNLMIDTIIKQKEESEIKRSNSKLRQHASH